MKAITSIANRIRLCRLAGLIEENKDFSENIGVTNESYMIQDSKETKISNKGGKSHDR